MPSCRSHIDVSWPLLPFFQVQLRLSRCSPQQLCNLMYSVSRLKLRPLAGWVDTLLLELYYKFDALSHVNPEILMAMTFLALSNSAAASSSNSAAGSSSGVASTSSAASGGNGSSRPASDSNAADAAASASPAAAEPSASGNCGNGSGSSSATGASGNGSSSASATAGLDSWMSVASPRLVAAMPSFNAQDLSNLLWSFANAGYQPPGEVAAAALVAARRLVPSFSCQALANVLWASGRLGLAMDEPLLQLLLQHSQVRLACWSRTKECLAYKQLDASHRLVLGGWHTAIQASLHLPATRHSGTRAARSARTRS